MRNMICDQRERERWKLKEMIHRRLCFFCGATVCRARLSEPKSGSIEISPIVHLAFPDHIIGSRRRVKEGSVSWLKGKRPRYDIVRFSCQASNRLRWNIWFPLSLWNTFWSSWSQEEKKLFPPRKSWACAFPFYELPTLLITWGWRWSDGLVEHK